MRAVWLVAFAVPLVLVGAPTAVPAASAPTMALAAPRSAAAGERDRGDPESGRAPSPGEVVANVAHRGASGYAPEHTFAAYDRAIAAGADFIEKDLQMTADGVLVVLHDTTLDRTATGPQENCTGLVRTKTLAQLKTCEVGSWFNQANPQYANPRYVGLQIPTLREVFQRYRHRVNYYIETKSPQLYPRMEEKLLALLDEFGLLDSAKRRWQVMIQSFSEQSLRRIDAVAPQLPLVQLVSSGATGTTLRARMPEIATYAEGLGPSHTDVDAALVTTAHEHCLAVHPYTVNDTDTMARLIDLGVDGMFTNVPDRLDAALGSRAVPGKRAATLTKRAHETCATS